MNWTDEQTLAIDKVGQNIIVSAGAGSGKTAVLTERVIRKLKKGVSISRLLVLTFTEAAASEMKDRIRKAIMEVPSLHEQLGLIDASYITTFDSYSLSIVKKYHYLLGISKNISIIDSSVINVLKKKRLEDIFLSKYENQDELFLKFINDFCDKDDENVKKSILKIANLLDMKVDREYFLDTYIDNYYSADYVNNLCLEYSNLVKSKLSVIKDLVSSISSSDGTYYEKVESVINPLLSASNYNDVRSCFPIKLPTLRDGDVITKYYKDELKSELDLLFELVRYDIDTLKNDYLSTKDYVSVIIDIIKELNCEIDHYKSDNNVYEFVDISKMAIMVLKENPSLREELRDFYNEIMVDEYQDTNDLQEAFISLLENNNVYMVGDIKQSIYRFRNANPDIFKNKYDNYSLGNGGIKIDLLKNFRSRQEVLKGINVMFDLIMDSLYGGADYKESHRMVYGNLSYSNQGFNNLNNDIELLDYHIEDKKYSREEVEIFTIANDIKKKMKDKYQVYTFGDSETHDITYSDFCIIMDRNTSFDMYKKVFEYLNIPLTLYKDEVLTSSTDILVIKNLLNFIVKVKMHEFDSLFKYYFTSVARSNLFYYSDDEIFKIFNDNSFKDDLIYKKALLVASDIDSLTNLEFLNRVIDEFDLYEASIKMGDVNAFLVKIEYLQNLALSLENLRYSPIDFANYISEMVLGDSDIKYSLNTDGGDSVRIMNIHKSKGLEFPVCYFSGLYKTFNTDDIKSRFLYDKKYGIITPVLKGSYCDTFVKTLYKNSYLMDEVSEKIRLFYVALTRVKEKAILVGDFSKDVVELNDNVKGKYRSFLDILVSIKNNLLGFMSEIDIESLGISRDYRKKSSVTLNSDLFKSNDVIDKKVVEVSSSLVSDVKFSKSSNKLITKEERKLMEYGTKMHYIFQVEDFKNSKNENVLKFLKHKEVSDIDKCNIYKEYEFMYTLNNVKYHGIIDLLLEYDDVIKIVDYKLKNVSDKEYVKQLNGYRNYIEGKTGKKVICYLYSIFDDEFVEISE